jgi:hypothetical protein
MKHAYTGLIAAVAIAMAGTATAQNVSMLRTVPYAAEAEVSSKVRSECVKLQDQLADFVREYGNAQGLQVQLLSSTDGVGGRVLEVEIVDAVSMGNAFIGHQKYTRVDGRLLEDGIEIGNFKGRRNSMGGAFGGYKGSCSVLGRTVKALGQDIAGWLRNPSEGARLGDM